MATGKFIASIVRCSPTVIANSGCSTYLIFGSFCFSMFVFVWFFIPETKGLSLEAMDALFGVTEKKPKDVTGDADDAHDRKTEVEITVHEHQVDRKEAV